MSLWPANLPRPFVMHRKITSGPFPSCRGVERSESTPHGQPEGTLLSQGWPVSHGTWVIHLFPPRPTGRRSAYPNPRNPSHAGWSEIRHDPYSEAVRTDTVGPSAPWPAPPTLLTSLRTAQLWTSALHPETRRWPLQPAIGMSRDRSGTSGGSRLLKALRQLAERLLPPARGSGEGVRKLETRPCKAARRHAERPRRPVRPVDSAGERNSESDVDIQRAVEVRGAKADRQIHALLSSLPYAW